MEVHFIYWNRNFGGIGVTILMMPPRNYVQIEDDNVNIINTPFHFYFIRITLSILYFYGDLTLLSRI